MADIYKYHYARIIGISDSKAVIAVGDTEYEIPRTPLLAIGDIYSVVVDNPTHLIEKIGAAAPSGWSGESDALRWRKRDAAGRTRLSALWQRHAIRRAVRDYMDAQGFIEIDTPILVHGTTPDAMIQSFAVNDRYLITSSEYQLRRLEVGGLERIYTLTQNFRRGDGEGPTRNQEFTMLEWVRVNEPLSAIEDDTQGLILAAHAALGGGPQLSFRKRQIDLTGAWDKISVAAAIEKYAGAKLSDFSVSSLRLAALQAGIALRPEWENDKYFLFSLLMTHIQPSLGWERPVLLRDWPAFETSSALEIAGSETAQRCELYIGGIEICNGFPSFTDYARQKQTFAAQLARRAADGMSPVALDDAYLAAMRAGLPPDSGMALGFDRLAMVLTDRDDLRAVMAFAWDEV